MNHADALVFVKSIGADDVLKPPVSNPPAKLFLDSSNSLLIGDPHDVSIASNAVIEQDNALLGN